VVLYLFESLKFKVQSSEYIVEIEKVKNQFPLKPLVVVINKTELLTDNEVVEIKTTRTTECDSRNDICQRIGVSEKNKLLSFQSMGFTQ
jgi:tRNA modification GTPase